MFLAPTFRRWLRPYWDRTLFLAAALPTLLFGSTLEGQIVWLHSHDDHDAHLHLLAAEDPAVHPQDLDAWHLAEHGDGDKIPPSESEEVPHGFFLSIPPVPASLTLSKNLTVEFAFALAPTLTQANESLETDRRTGLYYCSDPPQRGRLSGVAALLLSSHAILI